VSKVASPFLDLGPELHMHSSYFSALESSWNVMALGGARDGKWRGNWRMKWVASFFYTTSEHGISSITTAHAHTSAASSRLNGRPCQFKWTRPFCLKTKSGFCACAITFQTQSTTWPIHLTVLNFIIQNICWSVKLIISALHSTLRLPLTSFLFGKVLSSAHTSSRTL
jgi:hypothetical protein